MLRILCYSYFSAVFLMQFTSATQCGVDKKLTNGRCCTVCLPGAGVKEPCTEESDTVCEACADGSFSNTTDTVQTCQPCTECILNARPINHCRPHRDLTCECQYGFYASADGVCQRCTECAAGFGVSKSCTSTQDTLCRRCPSGTYNMVESHDIACIVCDACRDGQIMLHTCTPTSNTICLDKPAFENRARADFSQPGEPSPGDDPTSTNVIYCSIMGLIIVVTVVCVVVQTLRNRRRGHPDSGGSAYRRCCLAIPTRFEKAPSMQRYPTSFVTVLNSSGQPVDKLLEWDAADSQLPKFSSKPPKFALRPDIRYAADVGGCGASGRTDSGICSTAATPPVSAKFASHDQTALQRHKMQSEQSNHLHISSNAQNTTPLLISSLPAVKRLELENFLMESPDPPQPPSWVSLARSIGYTKSQIGQIEATAGRSSPSGHLLRHAAKWGKLTTLAELHRHLVRIKRDDISQKLRNQYSLKDIV